ncbi:MAG: metallopeptidase TldD-related protein, partial [Myxococcota bacterium]|nr:metallopeptidase TldD-related protein [Myxococcota bacterium]
PAPISFPAPPRPARAARQLDEAALHDRVAAITRADTSINSRIIYAAALLDIDDAHVWSLSPRHDREQRLVRVRKRVVRAAWSGSRPVISEAERSWLGDVDEHQLGLDLIQQATEAALLLTTPGGFEDGERNVLLDPSVTASLIDAGTRSILTTTAARRPEVVRRLSTGATFAAPAITLTDDPTSPGAYGGFAFDDEGQPAAPVTLIDAGRVVAVLGDRGRGRARRPGHVGVIEPAPSHLRLTAGTAEARTLHDDGFILEGGESVAIDPSTDRVVIGAARARELKGGVITGRVFADVELVGTLSSLLAAVTGVARETATFAYRDEIDGEPRWRSIEAPALRTRGTVRARWRRT